MTIDWERIAPRRDDWEALNKLFVAKGLPAARWRNGIPEWSTKVDPSLVEQIARAFTSHEPEATASPAQPVHKKHGGGWPKGKPRSNK